MISPFGVDHGEVSKGLGRTAALLGASGAVGGGLLGSATYGVQGKQFKRNKKVSAATGATGGAMGGMLAGGPIGAVTGAAAGGLAAHHFSSKRAQRPKMGQ